jgi:dihydrofolate reductase
MPLVKLYIAASLDGYIARPDGNLDWLMALPNPNNIDHDYGKFMETIGATIMGSATYKEVLGFGIEWPYPNIMSYVISRNPNLAISTPMTKLINEDVKPFTERLKGEVEKDIWLIGGGQLITTFLNYDLIDEITLTLIPTILGEGIQLFPDKPRESIWQFVEVKPYETGAVSVIYKRK